MSSTTTITNAISKNFLIICTGNPIMHRTLDANYGLRSRISKANILARSRSSQLRILSLFIPL